MFLASSFKLMLPAQCVRVQRPINQPAPAPMQAAPCCWPARNRQSCLPSACMSSAQLTNPPPCSHAGRPIVLASSFTFMGLVCTLGLGATAAFVVYYAIAGCGKQRHVVTFGVNSGVARAHCCGDASAAPSEDIIWYRPISYWPAVTRTSTQSLPASLYFL